MLEPGEKTGAFAAIKNRVFAERLGQRIARGLRDQVDSKVASKSSGVRIPTLSPIRRDARGVGLRGRLALRNSGGERGAEERVRAESIEFVSLQLFTFLRAMVLQA